MTKIRIYPYKQGSASARTLADHVGGKVLKLNNSRFSPSRGDLVINWGASNVPHFGEATVLNRDVSVAQCKLATLRALNEVEIRVPEFCTHSRDIPADWYPVVCRTKLRGHSGDGIVIANTPEELVDAPLYTKYIRKKDEYRVHVMRTAPVPGLGLVGRSAFFVQRKARKLDVAEPNWQVRNLAGGFVFVEVPIAEVPDDVINQAESAVEALELDFGGVDVMRNDREQRAYVLEINTACGLEDRTAEHYATAFRNLQAP